MKIFTSDLHHEHRRIVEFTNRGKDTAQEEHTEWLVNTWNSNVTKSDVCYHLGDYSFAKTYDDIAEYTSRLNGTKILLKGNHDKRGNLDQLVKDNLISAWFEYKEIKIGTTPVVLFHFPISSWHRQSHEAWHLHGHCHGNHKDGKGKILDVGIDSAYNIYGEHRFFTEEDIAIFMQDRSNYISDHHRENSIDRS
jgi:calcineurin-like phosphoesterase family protein